MNLQLFLLLIIQTIILIAVRSSSLYHPQHRVQRPQRTVDYFNPTRADTRTKVSRQMATDADAYSTVDSHNLTNNVETDEVQNIVVNNDKNLQNSQAAIQTLNNNNSSSSSIHTEDGILMLPTNMWNETADPDRFENFQNMRIRAVLSKEYESYLASWERDYLLEEVLGPALQGWSSALRVLPVSGSLVVDQSQLYDGVSCGPGVDSGYPSPIVPDLHMTEGIPDTDLVLYVSISFHIPFNVTDISDDSEELGESDKTGKKGKEIQDDDSNDWKGRSGTNSYGTRHLLKDENQDILDIASYIGKNDGSSEVPNSFLSGLSSYYNSSETTPAPSMYVDPRANMTDILPICVDPNTLASAVFCSTDQNDRPVAGAIHFCIDLSEDGYFFDVSKKQFYIKTAMHEIGHVLGFNSQSLAHFRNHDGSPRTPRDENGNVPDVQVQCTGPLRAEHQQPYNATIPLPSVSILNFTTTKNNVRVAEVVTENVRLVARNHFDCQDLQGAQLANSLYYENITASSLQVDNNYTWDESLIAESFCIGDHWDRRLFKGELMNPIVDSPSDTSSAISPLTLAYFLDSGWYQVDLGRSSHASSWGRGAGCNFVRDNCINEDGEVAKESEPFFCSLSALPRQFKNDAISKVHGCSADFSRKASCSLVKHTTIPDSIFEGYQYFGYTSTSVLESDDQDKVGDNFNSTRLVHEWIGGKDGALDYCPVYDDSSYKDVSLCTSEESESLRVLSMEIFGESNSRCVTAKVGGRRTGLCIPIACVESDRSLQLKVDGHWKKCSYEGQKHRSWWNPSNVIICPNPIRTCPTFFCPRNCLGTVHGVCDYETGACMCPKTIFSRVSSFYGACDSNIKPAGAFVSLEAPDYNTGIENYYFEDSTELVNVKRTFLQKLRRFFLHMNVPHIVLFIFMVLSVFGFIVVAFRRWLWSFIKNRFDQFQENRKKKDDAASVSTKTSSEALSSSGSFTSPLDRKSIFASSFEVESVNDVESVIME